MQLVRRIKDTGGMANSVDSNQSDLALHYLLGPLCSNFENFYGRPSHEESKNIWSSRFNIYTAD